ncbi:hypothetical protein MLC35_01070 [Sulfurimonas sp. NW7]|uniref:hypothetical protein n=1 Tax=Sulfurimonas sp. NW7 TaxID=2922727 RepID=UPI003DAA139C
MWFLFRNYIQIIKQFLQTKKKCISFIVFSSILLQALQLASFIVPLKMLFHLTSRKAFSYSVGSLFIVDTKEELAIVMVFVLLGLLGLMVGLEKVTTGLKQKCASDIWKESKKLHIYNNQEQLATNIYAQVTNGLGAFVFVLLIYLAILYLYRDIALVLLVFWMFSFLVVLKLFALSKTFQDSVENNLQKIIVNVNLIGFLIVFVFIAVDFLSSTPSTTIAHAVISLILVRHVSGSLSQFIMSVKNIYNQRVQIQNIFFAEKKVAITHQSKDPFKELFYKNYHREWVPDVLKKIVGLEDEVIKYEWYDFGVPNVVSLIITTKDKRYLVKTFAKHFQTQAINSASLYTECHLNALSLDFLGATLVEGFHCHIFSFENFTQIYPPEFQSKKLKILRKISEFEVPQSIISQYKMTHQLIGDRLQEKKLQDVLIVNDSDSHELLEWFETHFDDIIEEIGTLPVKLLLPGINPNTLVTDYNEDVKLVNFLNWSLEPLGFGFVTNVEKEMLKTLLKPHEYKKALIVNQLQMYEQNYNTNRLNMSLKIVADIKELYESDSEAVYSRSEDEFQRLLDKDNSKSLLQAAMKNVLDYDFEDIVYEWYELGIQNTFAFKVTVIKNNTQEEAFLIKIYNNNFYINAMSEVNLYEQCSELSLKLVGDTNIDGFICHIFNYDDFEKIADEEMIQKRFSMLEKISQNKIPDAFLSRYVGDHNLIYKRITPEKLNKLWNLVDRDEKEILIWFSSFYDKIVEDIRKLPLRLVLPMVNQNTLVVNTKKDVKLVSFHNWSIEPLGFAFMSNPEKELLKKILSEEDYKKALVVHYLRVCEQNFNANKLKEIITILLKIKNLYE